MRTTNRSPSGLSARGGEALAAEPELLAAGAARGDGQRLRAVERGDVDLGAEDGLADGDGDLDGEVAAVAGEVRVGLDVDLDGQVAGRRALLAGLALAAEPELGARLDPGGIFTTSDSRRPSRSTSIVVSPPRTAVRNGIVRCASRLCPAAARPRAPARAAPHPADQVLEDPGRRPASSVAAPPAPRRRAEELAEVERLEPRPRPPWRCAHSWAPPRGPAAAIPSNPARP